jgi:phosphatidylserine/phosphatidylglycerophosphate/cardiolipin synthase-like enzyme
LVFAVAAGHNGSGGAIVLEIEAVFSARPERGSSLRSCQDPERKDVRMNGSHQSPVGPSARTRATLRFGILATLVAASTAGGKDTPSLELVESVPVETTLGSTAIPDARDVWPEMIRGARLQLDWAAFYVSGQDGSALDAVLAEFRSAAARGVNVRLLADAGFYKTYPEWLDGLAASGVHVRLIDFRAIAGGVQHAKYFLVDGREAFVGSQNLDWRALTHIIEMGLRVRVPGYVAELGRIFEMDWARARPIGPGASTDDVPPESGLYVPAEDPDGPFTWSEGGADVSLWPAFSPRGHLRSEGSWDLPRIIERIDAAKDSVCATMLSYKPESRDHTYWEEIENAFRRAAVRGVRIRLCVADWGTEKPGIDFLKSLDLVPSVEVKLVTIPEATTGFVPFARVTHAKYMTVDGRWCWLGTSNWEKSYFYTTRNVGVLCDHPSLTRALDGCFRSVWESAYAHAIDPSAEYTPPRVRE